MLEVAAAGGKRRVGRKARPAPRRTRPPLAGPRVIIIDDDVELREALAELLLSEGYQVERAIDGPDALLLARVGEPDVMLVDLAMPGMDGYEVARRMKADPTTSRIPIVAMTGRYPSSAPVVGRAPGVFSSVLLKPLVLRALLMELSRLTAAGHFH